MATKTKFGLKGKDRDSYLELILAFPLASICSDEHLNGAQKAMDCLLAKGELDDGEETRNFTAQDGPIVSRDFLRLGQRLLELGAVGLKCESSGIAHGRTRWLELARESAGDNYWEALMRAFVQLPIWNGQDFHTCGLQLLGLPDLIVSDNLLREGHGANESQAWQAVDLFRAFACYLLSECSPGRFFSGHTFSPAPSMPRFRVSWEDCTGYDEDEFFFNPFGRWRFAKLVEFS